MTSGECRISVASPDGSGDVMWNGYAKNAVDALELLILALETGEITSGTGWPQ